MKNVYKNMIFYGELNIIKNANLKISNKKNNQIINAKIKYIILLILSQSNSCKELDKQLWTKC